MKITKKQTEAIAAFGKDVDIFETSAYDSREKTEVDVIHVSSNDDTLAMLAEDGVDVLNV